jgi:hypothetical protein
VTLSGTGTAIAVSPKSALAYGNVKVGNKVSKTITVTNLGSASVAVSSIALSGAGVADYQQTNTCTPSLAGNSSCSITVTFAPSVTGARPATLTITDADPSSPQTISITGSGI